MQDPVLSKLVEDLYPQVTAQREKLISFWTQHGPDTQYGGFHSTLDRDGSPITSSPSCGRKGLVQQTRYLWTISTYYHMFIHKLEPSIAAKMKDMADSLFTFIMDHFLDREANLFWWEVEPNGDKSVSSINIYGNFFAVYGLAKYAEVFKSQVALDQALATFHAIDARSFDPVNGGYDQAQDQPVLDLDASGHPVPKGFNSNLHGMEALTQLYIASGSDVVKDRLVQLIKVLVDKAIVSYPPSLPPPSTTSPPITDLYGLMYFDQTWNPILGQHQTSHQVSHGHFLEFFWLLVESLEALGAVFPEGERERVLHRTAQAAEYSAKMGTTGTQGYCEHSAVGEGCGDPVRCWWVQNEALLGLWQLYLYTGKAEYLTSLRQTVDWILHHQTDTVHGEQYAMVDSSLSGLSNRLIGSNALSDERLISFDGFKSAKASFWKTSYHSTRAFMNLGDWMKKLTK